MSTATRNQTTFAVHGEFDSEPPLSDDAILGAKALGWTLNVISWVAAAAIAWCFSGFWMVLLAWIISSLVMGLLHLLLAMLAGTVIPTTGFEAGGRLVNKLTRGYFAKK